MGNRKPDRANVGAKSTGRVFNEQAFIDGVYNNEYILVVGSGVILNRKKFPHSDGDVNQHIIDIINSNRRKEQRNFIDHNSFTDIYKGTRHGEEDPIFTLLTEDIKHGGFKYKTTDISQELSKLLQTKLFRFVATTTIDNFLETLLRKIWGEELRIVNIEDDQSITDFKTAYEDCRQNEYNQPTLFYIFGKVKKEDGSNPRKFVETDEDAIKCIEKWMQLDKGNKSIVPFLRTKRLLALGCKFDNWYFRFFWYVITRGFGINDRDGNPRTIDNLAIIFNPDSTSDNNLKDYLAGIDVCMHNDVWKFMGYIHTLLTSTAKNSPFRDLIFAKRREGGIFISYKSIDVLEASSLFCKLSRENGLNVWFDNISLNVGDPYESVIRNAISKARIFIPILSPSIAKELVQKNKKIDTFYSNEWRWAKDNAKLKIFPVAIDGYDLRSDYHKVFEQIIGYEATTGVDMMTKPDTSLSEERVGYAKLIKSIYKELGIEELWSR